MTLPIETILPGLRQTFERNLSVVLVADPGAGKTTRVPLALLEESWLAGKRIVMLEPRRIAARAAARRMAATLGEAVGETVGYRVKQDTRVSANTRIEVITEGVLTRMLQHDPALEGVGVVIFDEFHERSLHSDLGLALCLQSREILREDLRILVMSATLHAEPIAELLRGAPVLRSAGRAFPVETRYLENRRGQGDLEQTAARAVVEALEKEQGDIMVFLPGSQEIRRVEARLLELVPKQGVHIAPLYGSLPLEAQDRAIAPCAGHRKVVLCTSIAETSLTVEGIRIVIDSGLMRVSRFSPRTGMSRLETVSVSRASADQRRGRAGRLGPGICCRLWTEQEDQQLAPQGLPEIMEADLAPLALELAIWGTADPAELDWLTPPPAAAFGQARDLLKQLDALDEAGAVTDHGRNMAKLGLHPRMAHMMLQATPHGYGRLACELAALLGERDVVKGISELPDADIRLRIEALRKVRSTAKDASPPQGYGYTIDAAACRRIVVEADRLERSLGSVLTLPRNDVNVRHKDADACGVVLGFAFPDRIAQRKDSGRFLLSSGRGAVFAGSTQALAKEPYVIAAVLDDAGADSRIFLAGALSLSDIERYFQQIVTEESDTVWDAAAQAVRSRTRTKLGALVLRQSEQESPEPEALLAAWLHGFAQEGLDILPWNKQARQLQRRLDFMHAMDSEWPEMSDEALLAHVSDWLGPHLYGRKSRQNLQSLNMTKILEEQLTWKQRNELDELAPTHFQAPSGSRIAVDYSDPNAPFAAVRLQEMFGLTDTPRIGKKKIPLILHLLSPAQRPVQVTRDLASFWKEAYFEVKKDLKGRYPKHYWPDDPMEAVPTSRTRPR